MYENTVMSVHSILHIQVEMISLINPQRLNWENSAIASCRVHISLFSMSVSSILDQSNDNKVIIPTIKDTKFITHQTINQIQNRFQNTLHHFFSVSCIDQWRFSFVNSSVSTADISQKVALVPLYITDNIKTTIDTTMIPHHTHIIDDCMEEEIILHMININPQTINKRAGIIST